MAAPLATISILSIGQMGLGVARLLIAHNYRILTSASDRSAATQERAKSASVELVQTDAELVAQSDYILSIVPPRDAVATATRIINALSQPSSVRRAKSEPLYYLDLNAIAPSTARKIDSLFKASAPEIRFVDGGIIGGPPSPPHATSPLEPRSPTHPDASDWKRPGVPLSGPYPLHEAPVFGAHLASILHTKYLDDRIGTASGLKCTFAALSKGFAALALQSFTTASSLGVLPDLQHYLELYNPSAKEKSEKSVTGCPSKAYRWVEEMNQIGECFAEEGGWPDAANVFRGVSGVFEELARVVEKNGGTEGMGTVDGAIGMLSEGLKVERRMSVEELEQDDR